jgi:hypothetical protein
MVFRDGAHSMMTAGCSRCVAAGPRAAEVAHRALLKLTTPGPIALETVWIWFDEHPADPVSSS